MKLIGGFGADGRPVARLLAVGDPVGPLRAASVHLAEAGYEVDPYAARAGMLASLEAGEAFDAALVDVGDEDGVDVIDELARAFGIPVVAVYGPATVERAVAATRAGAADVVASADPEKVYRAVIAALGKRSASAPGAGIHVEAVSRRPDGLVGSDPSIVLVMRRVEEYARSQAPVLITGETGTGKELVARGIHAASPRARAPFVAVNCGAIPAELFESEFFGHEKGAFTGATASAAGHLATASGGTLFLDEVGTMPLPLQAKLLRVIQEQEYEPIGSRKARRADVRLIAATNADLEAAIRDGSFREDLYYRLRVLPIQLPPLRERPGDIPQLAEHFLRQHAARVGDAPRSLSRRALAQLAAYAWPGNVRELAGAIERAALCTPGPVIHHVLEGGRPEDEKLPRYADALERLGCRGGSPVAAELRGTSMSHRAPRGVARPRSLRAGHGCRGEGHGRARWIAFALPA